VVVLRHSQATHNARNLNDTHNESSQREELKIEEMVFSPLNHFHLHCHPFKTTILTFSPRNYSNIFLCSDDSIIIIIFLIPQYNTSLNNAREIIRMTERSHHSTRFCKSGSPEDGG
jgi:hypothetical protein